MLTTRGAIFQLVNAERQRQEAKAKAGEFAWSAAAPDVPDALRLAVLVEEVGEVACAVLGENGAVSDGGDLQSELVQVAAVAVAWLEGRRRA